MGQALAVEGFAIAAEHFVERHVLIVIVALGESIVVIGAAAELALDAGLAIVVLLGLALTASFWWLYFSDEDTVEQAMLAAPSERRLRLVISAFGYWHYGLLLAIVAVAASLKKAVARWRQRAQIGGLAAIVAVAANPKQGGSIA